MFSIALGFEARLACMAGLRFQVRLDFASKISFEVGSMAEWIDDVLSIVLPHGRSSKANKITDNQILLCPRTPSQAPRPAGQFTLLADSVGRFVASSRVGTLLSVPSQEILIDTVETLLPNCARAPPR